MKEIKTVNELLSALREKKSIYHEVNGKKYEFNVVRILQTTLGDLIQYVADGNLYYDVTT